MLRRVRAELAIEINRTPEDVFAYLTDVSNLPAWQSGVHSAQIEDAGDPRVGARIRESRSRSTMRDFHTPMTFATAARLIHETQ